MDEDWQILKTFLPEDWREMAITTGALKGLRQDKCPEKLLRTLLIHLACGHSLRETVIRADKAKLASLSDVALLKRLKKSKEWLYSMCVALFKEHAVPFSELGGHQARVFDATTIKEPGKTGSLWRLHYSVRLPSLNCDFFKLTETHGKGTGENITQFPLNEGEYILADRGYSSASGIDYASSNNAYVTVRVNSQTLPMYYEGDKSPFDLLKAVKTVKKAGRAKSWSVCIAYQGRYTSGRLCVLKKSKEAIALAQEKIRRLASKKGTVTKPETLEYAKYIILFSTFPEDDFSKDDILNWYRLRWQVELVFKRFKSIAKLGHLPKYDNDSAEAWLYGKLLVALLAEKMMLFASSISPWGYIMESRSATKPLA